jgi:hypothetical protein
LAKNKAPRTVTVDVTLALGRGVERPPSRLYLFDQRGNLVHSELVTGKPVNLALAGDGPHRLVVGPDLAVKGRSAAELATELTRARAISRDVNPKQLAESIKLAIPPSIYICWWQTCIYVHGSVRKQTAPGVYAPICSGVVQIFQVDLGCTLDQLASFTDLSLWYAVLVDILHGLDRQVALERIRMIPNLPDPPPDSFHETSVVVSRTTRQARATMAVSAEARAAMPMAAQAITAARSVASSTVLRAASSTELAATLRALPIDARKEVILANKALIAPWLCWLIPDSWFCWQELGEAAIQSDGTFSAEVCFWCPNDFPDLYFEVVQTVGGIAREISDPQIACSTYYDYDGSTDVVITVDDPTAVACNDPKPPPVSGYYVWPTAIGNTDLRGIVGLESPTGPAPHGLLATSPWGGTLALQMEFDPRLKSDGIARYYRWSYKFAGDPLFSPISAPVNHRYKTVTGVFPNINIHLTTVNLGPHTVGAEQNLFDVPDPYPSDGWVNISDPWDRPFAYFDSTDNHYSPFSYIDLAPRRSGLCTLLLEMFDAAGSLVSCANNGLAGPFVFVLPDLTKTPSDYTSTLGPDNITASGQLLFQVLIDNNDTIASIGKPTASGNLADDCGILHYSLPTDAVAIPFHATHPNNYLSWTLEVFRGSSGLAVPAIGGNSSSPPLAPNPFSNTASALLGAHCTNAAFAVDLWTSTTATDGYSSQTQYNRFDSMAFALLTP